MRLLAIAAAIALHGSAAAGPLGATASFGQTQVSRPDANTTRIDQSTPRAGIDWQSFSISDTETVRVVQPSSKSVLVNRVTGLEPSLILGRLQANGRVFLTNPRGVVFGEGAQVDVGGLVATTLSLGDADAQAGRWWLQDGGQAGALRNAGQLRAADGSIVLLAPQLENSGSISARRVALGAVSAARIDLDGDGLILFNTRSADAARLDQLGRVIADGGRAELIAQARGQIAGSVLNLRGAVFARGLGLQGGEVVIDGGGSGIVEIGSRVDVSSAGGTGGGITALGDRVLLDHTAQLDASGARGGGRIAVGGGFQGHDAALHNASAVVVQGGAVLDASATLQGDGGRIVVWSDQATRFAGRADARGGTAGGDGGLVEVSGKARLDFNGRSDRSAPAGRSGLLLLDPQNLEIVADGQQDIDGALSGAANDLASTTLVFSAFAGADSRISVGALTTQLGNGDVQLQAVNNITVTQGFSTTAAHALALEAGNNVLVNGAISTGGNISLSASAAGIAGRSTTGAVRSTAGITTPGQLSVSNGGGSGVHALSGPLSVGGQLRVDGGGSIGGTISGTGGLAKLGAGTLTLSGANTYVDDTTVGGGTLRLSASTAAGTGTIALGANTLDITDGAVVANLVTVADGASIISSAGGGTLTNAQTLTLAAGPSTLRLSGGPGDALVVARDLVGGSGDGRAVEVTGGRVTLSGRNSQDSTTVRGGTLTVVADALPDAGTVTIDGGALALGGASETVGALVLKSGSIIGNGTLVSNTDFDLRSGSVSAALGGAAGLVKGTTDTVTLTAANSYTGNTRIAAGTLRVEGAGTLGSTAASATVNSGGTLWLDGAVIDNQTLTLAGGALRGSGTTSVTGSVVLGSDATIEVDSGGTLALGDAVSGIGRGLSKTGAGTLRLDASNSYTGTTAVQDGTLVLGSAERLADDSALTVAGIGRVVLNGDERVASLSLSGTLDGVGSTLRTANQHYTLEGGATVNANLGGGTLDVNGNARLNGTAAIGTVNLNAGTLTLGSTLGTADRLRRDVTVNLAANSTLALDVDQTVANISGSGQVVTGSGTTFTIDNGNNVAFAGSISGSGNLKKFGAGDLELSGVSSYSGATTVNDGILRLVGGNDRLPTTTALTVENAARLDLNGFSQQLSAFTGGAVDGPGVLRADSFTLQSGLIGANVDIGAVPITVTGFYTLGAQTGASNVDVASGGVLTLSNSGIFSSTAELRVAGTLTLAGNESVGLLRLAGTLGGVGSTLTAANGYVLDSGATVQANLGTGTLTVQGNATLSGSAAATDVTLRNGATLTTASSNRLAAGATLTLQDGSTLNLGGFSETVGALNLQNGNIPSGALTAGSFSVSQGSIDARLSGSSNGSGLTKTGTAAVLLTGANEYSGATEVQQGTLALQNGGRLGDSTSGTTVRAGATLELRATGSGSGEAISLDGGPLLAGGRLLVTGGASSVPATGTLALASGATLAVAQAGDSLTLASSPHGAGAPLTKTGSGTLTLAAAAGPDSYGGATQVNGGTLALGTNGALPSGTTLQIDNGARLALGNFSNTVAGLTLLDGSVSAGSGQLSSAGVYDLRSGSVDALLAGGASLTKGGGSTSVVALSRANTYDGATTVDSGTLRLTGAGTLGSTTGETTVSDRATLQLLGAGPGSEALTLAGAGVNAQGALRAGGGALTVGGRVTLSQTASIGVDGSGDLLVLAQSPRGAGSTGLTKVGAGVLRLDAAAVAGTSHGGPTTVDAGTLRLGVADALPDTSAVTVNNGATLDPAGNSDAILSLLLDNGSIGAGRLTASSFELRSGSVQADLAGPGSLVKSTPGSVQLSAAARYAGSTRLTGGTLQLNLANALPTATALTVGGDATLAIGAFDTAVASVLLDQGSITGSGRLTGSSDHLLRQGSVSARLAGPVGLQKTGGGTVTLSGSNLYTGATTVGEGTLALAAAELLPDTTALQVAANATLRLNGNETVGSATLAGTLGGSGTLTAASYTLQRGADITANLGAGTLNVSGATRLAGVSQAERVNVQAETLTLASRDRLADNATVNVATGATLALNGNDTIAALTLYGTLSGIGTLTAASTTLSGGTASADIAGSTLTSTGSSRLDGHATFPTVDVASGTLTLGSAGRLNSLPAVTVAGGAALNLGGDETIGSLAGAGNVGLGSAALATGSGGDSVFSGVLAGSGGLVKQGTSTFTLAGANTYSGATRVLAGTLALAAADRLSDATAVEVARGAALTLNGNDTVQSLTLAGTLSGNGTLTAERYALDGGAAATDLGLGALASKGSSRLDGRSAAATVDVTAGTLTLGAADRLADGAAVSVAAGSTLQLNGSDSIGSLALAGVLNGSGTLTAATYLLDGGSANTDLGTGTLRSQGGSALNGTAGIGSIVVTGGQLTVARSGALTAVPQIEVQAGTLRLAGAQTVGAVTNAGSLQTGSALNALSVASSGSVLLGGSISTSGNQNFQGVVQAAEGNTAPALSAGDQAQIVALNAGNDFGGGLLSLRAGSVQLHDAGALSLGQVRLGSGASAIDATGVLHLQGALALTDGQLVLASAAPAVATGAALRNNLGNQVFLPNPLDGTASSTRLVAAQAAILQDDGAVLATSAASTLHLRASGGGSIELGSEGNRIAGMLSAVSGSGTGYALTQTPEASRVVSLVTLRAGMLNLVADSGGGDAVRADVVRLAAQQLSTAAGATVRARLPYSVKQGPGSQLQALNFDIGTGSSGFGSLDAPVGIRFGNVEAATGIGGLYLTTLPAPVAGLPGTAALYLDCGGCTVAPFYQYAGDPGAVVGFIGGHLLAEAPPAASAVTSNTALLEDARRNLFEAAVRTENVRGRLRAGVIAEVGKGRPATQSARGARRPEACEANPGTLSCGADRP